MFGLGKGKIEVKLNKLNFSPGETIEGTVSLQLKKEISAKGLIVTMFGEQKVSQLDSQGRRTTRKVKIYDFPQTIDGEKEYSTQIQEYNFQIKVPGNLLQSQAPEGMLGTALQAAQFLSGKMTQVSWFIEAKLDVPRGFDVSKKLQINLA